MKDVADIFLIRGGGIAGDLWLFDKLGEPLVAGPDAIDSLRKWATRISAFSSSWTPGELYRECRWAFRGASLIHRCDQWAQVDARGGVVWKKNRQATPWLPFASPEEMTLYCAAAGWPDPEWLDDAIRAAARRKDPEEGRIIDSIWNIATK